MRGIWTGGIVVLAVGVAWGCGPVDEDAPNRQEDTITVEREERRTSTGLALRTDTMAGEDRYLTDGSGRSLYVRVAADGKEAECDEACEEQWPPFAVSSDPPAAEGGALGEDLIGSAETPDGTMQITYDGRPLHFYHADREPGDRKGHGMEDPWGEWYLVGPDGEPVEAHGEGRGGPS